MSTCNPHFRKFDERLTLNQTRKDKIQEKRSRLDRYLRHHDELKELNGNGTFLQGSYNNGTIIKPRSDGEYDVDVCWRIKNPAELGFETVQETVDFVVRCLREDHHYKEKVVRKNRCIRIDYEGEFHLDLILMRTDSDCPRITGYEENTWIDSDPDSFDEWVRETNNDAEGTLRRMVRHVREWAVEQFDEDSRPPGIFLTEFVGRHHVLTRNVARRGMDHRFTGPRLRRRDPGALLADTLHIMHGCWNNRGKDHSMCLPVRPFDDLTASWTPERKRDFGDKLWAFYQTAARACNADTDDDGADIWKEAFGDRFPLTL